MMNLARKLRAIEPGARRAPWPGFEHSRGYAVMALPFSSGHLLGLRVFPETDFAPYHSVWHRTPQGDWSIYNDGPSLQTTCPRWWGPALRHAELARIEVRWTGPADLRIEMEAPRLEWTMTVTASPLVRAVNAASAALPLWTWRPAPLRRVREWIAKRFFGLGELRFSFVTPQKQHAVVMPEQIFFIASSQASLEGRDLGHPVRLARNPTIGDVPLPTRGTLVIGQAFGRIKDPDEYERTRKRVANAGSGRHQAHASG